MSDIDPAAWLRRQIAARLALAREASSRADTHWWRRRNEYGPVSHLWTGEPVRDIDGDVVAGEQVIVYDEGAPSEAQFDHITANDPLDVIARCEAELAILDLHASDGYPVHPECVRCAGTHPANCECGWQSGGGEHWRSARAYPCRTVRLLLSAYRYREGFNADWLHDATPA